MNKLLLLTFAIGLFSTRLMAQGDISKLAGFYKCTTLNTAVNYPPYTKTENCKASVRTDSEGQYFSVKLDLDRDPKFPSENQDIFGFLLGHDQKIKKIYFGCIDEVASLKNIAPNQFQLECYGTRGTGEADEVMSKVTVTIASEDRVIYQRASRPCRLDFGHLGCAMYSSDFSTIQKFQLDRI